MVSFYEDDDMVDMEVCRDEENQLCGNENEATEEERRSVESDDMDDSSGDEETDEDAVSTNNNARVSEIANPSTSKKNMETDEEDFDEAKMKTMQKFTKFLQKAGFITKKMEGDAAEISEATAKGSEQRV